MKVFVDTAALLALFNKKDSLHQQARQQMSTLRQKKAFLITTEFVLLEVADAFSQATMKRIAIEYINSLRQFEDITIMLVSEQLLAEGWRLYTQRLDKDWGLTDCTSFVVMNKEKITQAFTSDHHFEQAGFTKLL